PVTDCEREGNSRCWHFPCNAHGEDVRLYKVNAGKFIYEMSAKGKGELRGAVQIILDDYRLEGTEQNLGAMDYVAAEGR
ncbi:phage head morphogenesis protein, partial [Klebsiella pneumoniae]|nr:phage head morphogenesis protein [Klebsiella pneumoniae]